MVRNYVKKEINIRLPIIKRKPYVIQSTHLKSISKCIMEEKLRDVNIYLQTFGLQLKNDCLQRANETELKLKIELEEQQKVTDLTYLQVKDKNKLSDMKYKGIADTLKLPSNYMIDKTKKKIDDTFTNNQNKLGFYALHNKKLEHVLQTFIDRNPDFAQTELKIKLSLDSCNIAKPKKTILNVAFTHIDDKQTAMSVKGNYLLGVFEIEKEDYKSTKEALKEINQLLKNLNHITLKKASGEPTQYKITKYLGCDLKMLAILYGINAASSHHPCIWCEFNVVKDSVGQNLTVKEWPITRRIENSRDFLGSNADPIIDYIDFDHCVVDMLHLLLRISEVLFSSLILILKDLDSATSSYSKNIGDHVYLKRFFDFIKEKCSISHPYFFCEKDSLFELRSFNSNELKKIFTNLYDGNNNLYTLLEIDLVNLQAKDTSLYYRLLSYNYLLKEFYILYCDAKEDFDLTKFEEIKQRLQKWTDIFSKSGSFNSEKLTPYLHIFCHHLPELIKLHKNINLFTCQGLEKKNELTKFVFHNKTNKKKHQYLDQILKLITRIELYGDDDKFEKYYDNLFQ